VLQGILREIDPDVLLAGPAQQRSPSEKEQARRDKTQIETPPLEEQASTFGAKQIAAQ
jgi:hypothetical protein